MPAVSLSLSVPAPALAALISHRYTSVIMTPMRRLLREMTFHNRDAFQIYEDVFDLVNNRLIQVLYTLPPKILSCFWKKSLMLTILYLCNDNTINTVIFWNIITVMTTVFCNLVSHDLIFRNQSNMLICCSRIYYWKQFLGKRVFFSMDSLYIYEYIYIYIYIPINAKVGVE